MTDGSLEFWDLLDKLVAEHAMVIDRPRGSRHPRYPDYVYPLDYGYLAGTVSPDGGGIDLWRGSLPGGAPVAVIVSVDYRKKDSEMKILCGCTREEVEIIFRDHNRTPDMKGLLIERHR